MAGTPAAATCDLLLRSVTLAEQNFMQQQAPSDQRLNRLNATIASLQNDEVLRILRASGQAGAFGDLRNHLTHLKFMAQVGGQPDSEIVFTRKMQTDLAATRQIVNRACLNPANTPLDADAAQPSVLSPQADVTAQTTEPGRSLFGPRLRKILSPEQVALLEQTFQLQVLAKLLGGVLVTAGLAVGAHYAVLAIAVIRRNRRTCKVPATLTSMMIDTPGHITIIGRLGCRFTPAEDAPIPQALSAGSYTTVTVEDQTFNGKTIFDVGEHVSLYFNSPLDRPTVSRVLKSSVTPPRYDFSVIQARGRDAPGFRLGLPRRGPG